LCRFDMRFPLPSPIIASRAMPLRFNLSLTAVADKEKATQKRR
jgi:hypothetical protein